MPPTVKGRTLDYDQDEEHILRRLGAALVVQWDGLSEIQREILLAQAVMMTDRVQTVQLREQIKIFINKHKANN
jgi:hypothetical protein